MLKTTQFAEFQTQFNHKITLIKASKTPLKLISELQDELNRLELPNYDREKYNKEILELKQLYNTKRSKFVMKRKNNPSSEVKDSLTIPSSQSSTQSSTLPSTITIPSTLPSTITIPSTLPSAITIPSTQSSTLPSIITIPSTVTVKTVNDKEFDTTTWIKNQNVTSSNNTIENMMNCKITVPNTKALFLYNLVNCILELVTVETSVMIRNCKNCVFYYKSTQARIHDSLDLIVYCNTKGTMIQGCRGIQFGALDGCELKVDDFDWLKKQKSPNFKIIKEYKLYQMDDLNKDQ
jgi:hypothetical protein